MVATTDDGREALWFSVLGGASLIKLLLSHGGNPNLGKEFFSPFHQLLEYRPSIDKVRLMLEHGADCTLKDTWGYHAFHCFVQLGSDVRVFKALIDAVADINATDNDGDTPLHMMMSVDPSLEILGAFLENGAIVNAEDNKSESKSL